VEELSRTTAQATHIWAEARKRSDFAHYRPMLEKLVRLVQEKADRLGWDACRYDALLNEFEPGARTADIATLFATLGPAQSRSGGTGDGSFRASAGGLVEGRLSHYRPAWALIGRWPKPSEFDFKAGRIDTTAHPFCTEMGPYRHATHHTV